MMMMKLILEGPVACGKSTLAMKLVGAMVDLGYTVHRPDKGAVVTPNHGNGISVEIVERHPGETK